MPKRIVPDPSNPEHRTMLEHLNRQVDAMGAEITTPPYFENRLWRCRIRVPGDSTWSMMYLPGLIEKYPWQAR